MTTIYREVAKNGVSYIQFLSPINNEELTPLFELATIHKTMLDGLIVTPRGRYYLIVSERPKNIPFNPNNN